MSKKICLFMLFLLVLLVGGGTYWHLQDVEKKRIEEPLAKETKCQYKNVNPLRCEPDMAVKKKEFVVLRNELNDYIEKKQKERKVSIVSVYFRDLQNGPIMSINGQEEFTPASLLKLPILIAYYKKAEEHPELLEKTIEVPNAMRSIPQFVKPDSVLQPGSTYTINEMIESLIKHSDNIASTLLLAYLQQHYPQENFVSTLSDLGIVDPKKNAAEQILTVQNYSSIFRILYNSSYLNVDMSDKALQLLMESEFKDGIVAGVPKDMKVAHKFGERENNGEQQLHDCGIVYYPTNPYIICVMTRGDSIEELKPIIKEISKKVYDEVAFRNRN